MKVKREGKREWKHKEVMSEEEQETCIPLEFCVQAILQLYKNRVFFPRTYCFFSASEVVKMYERWKKTDFQICIDAKNNKFKCMLLFKFWYL